MAKIHKIQTKVGKLDKKILVCGKNSISFLLSVKNYYVIFTKETCYYILAKKKFLNALGYSIFLLSVKYQSILILN